MAKSHAGGIAILALGLVILLGKWGVISFLVGVFWPLLLIGLGLLLHTMYFGRSAPSVLLVPGGISLVYGLMFLICTFFGWHAMAYVWPGFILGAAVGCYEWFLFDRQHPRAALGTAAILGVVGVVFLGFTLLIGIGVYVVAVLLILVGAFFLLRRSRAW